MTFVVIGGGLAGLMAARSLMVGCPSCKVVLIERRKELGGLLAGTLHNNLNLYFDQGTHIFRETGNREIDDFLIGSLPESDLIHFDVGQGDLSGAIFDGKLQTAGHFPDIRNRPDSLELLTSLKVHTTQPIVEIKRTEPVLKNSQDRFGELYTMRVLAPILSSLYQHPVETLAGFALLLPGLMRVIAMDYNDWLMAANCERHRALFAVPDQRQLPAIYHHGRRSYYSRRQGSRALIEGVTQALVRQGMTILHSTHLTSLDLETLTLKGFDSEGCQMMLKAKGVVMATGIIGAAHLLQTDLRQFHFDLPILQRVVNLVVDAPIDSDLCYFYGLDPAFDFYRVTNYRSFSGNHQDRRLSIEVIGNSNLEDSVLPTHLVKQLYKIKFLKNTKFSFAEVRNLATGFPAPTVQNMQALASLSQQINQRLPDSVVVGGIGSHSNLFFQNEVIEDIYQRAQNLLSDN